MAVLSLTLIVISVSVMMLVRWLAGAAYLYTPWDSIAKSRRPIPVRMAEAALPTLNRGE